MGYVINFALLEIEILTFYIPNTILSKSKQAMPESDRIELRVNLQTAA